VKPALAVSGLLLAVMLAGCTSPPEGAAPSVVATFYPVAFLATRIAGDHQTVTTLIPADAEPHDYELKPSDTATIQRARLVVFHGLGLEPFGDNLASIAAEAGVAVQRATEGMPAVERDVGDGSGIDPHTWLDPFRTQLEARNIADALARVDAANATDYEQNLVRLQQDLATLDREYAQGLASCDHRKIITTHVAFGYMADRYNFSQIAISGLEPDAEPSAAKVREIADLARRENITVIFFETLVSPRVAQVIADEVGGTTQVLDPVEGLTPEAQSEGKDYLSIMRDNLAHLRDAMRCR
jgi:zinc transport system substrate-binding protein